MLATLCRWVPCLLILEQMAHRVAVCSESHTWLQGEGEAEFCNVITAVKLWMFHYDPESKQQSSQWKTLATPVPKEAEFMHSAGYYDNNFSR